MSHGKEYEQDPEHEHEHDHDEDEDAELNDEDVVEVIEDEGDEPMDDDDDNDKYDGEIVIGAPMPGEEEEMEQMMEDNTLGATCRSSSIDVHCLK
jgi:hypothetical protein